VRVVAASRGCRRTVGTARNHVGRSPAIPGWRGQVWKGDDAGYDAKHKRLPKATTCVFGCVSTTGYENAHYLGEVGTPDEYFPACRRCHTRFDRAMAMMFKPVVLHGDGRWLPFAKLSADNEKEES
jgi:hypothetical protein